MAIFHQNIQILSRAKGRSSIAAAAYRAGERIMDERLGRVCDYSRKRDVVYSEIILPDNAPTRFHDRSTLWNEVERYEKRGNAQVAREMNFTLPRELDRATQVALAREYAQIFVDAGMICDLNVHDKDGVNPHAHLMLTMKPVNNKGFTSKTAYQYLVRHVGGKEKVVSGKEYKKLGDEWEKVYIYKGGQELTQSQAINEGLDPVRDRKRKSPIQNSIHLTDWDDKNKCVEWREQLATITNKHLERKGISERVDHRSYREQGIEKIPTIWEGAVVRQLEKQEQARAERLGYEYEPVTDRRRENVRIKTLNERFEQMVEKLKRSIMSMRRTLTPLKKNASANASKRAARQSRSRRNVRRPGGMSR